MDTGQHFETQMTVDVQHIAFLTLSILSSIVSKLIVLTSCHELCLKLNIMFVNKLA